MPSKYAELARFEFKHDLPYRGYHHHRWIYQIKNNVLVGFPKMNFHEYVKFDFDNSTAAHTEIAFLWESKFDFNFLSPSQMLDNRSGADKFLELLEDDDLPLEQI